MQEQKSYWSFVLPLVLVGAALVILAGKRQSANKQAHQHGDLSVFMLNSAPVAAPEISATGWVNPPALPETPLPPGKVILLDFWATWCPPCVRSLPHTQELYETYKDRGLEVIAIHSVRGAETAGAFAQENGYTFPIALDSGATGAVYGVEAIPSYYLIDKNGKLVWGPFHTAPPEQIIESLLEAESVKI